MPKIAAFETHHLRYEQWFEAHKATYVSELLALRPFVPWQGQGLEVGVGTGRFAAPLGVRTGVDPSSAMLSYAAARGIKAVRGAAENLPFRDGHFDFILVVTTLCFVDSPVRLLTEAQRVLRPGGRLVVGFIDRASPLGQMYELRRAQNVFYRDAVFHSAPEVEQILCQTGYVIESWAQTLAGPLVETHRIDPLLPGYGRCAFVVVCARRPNERRF